MDIYGSNTVFFQNGGVKEMSLFYLSAVIINSENNMPSYLMIVFFRKIEICLALHVPGK
jgi:hypothetical protein